MDVGRGRLNWSWHGLWFSTRRVSGYFQYYNKHPSNTQSGKFPREQLVSYPKSPVKWHCKEHFNYIRCVGPPTLKAHTAFHAVHSLNKVTQSCLCPNFEAIWGNGGTTHTVLTSILDGEVWSVSRPGRITRGRKAPATLVRGDGHYEEVKNLLPQPRIEPRLT
jgi:hypothetical protein